MISVEISNDNLINLFGAFDCNARYVEETLSVRLIPCDGELKIEGKDEISEQRAEQLFVQLIRLIGMGFSVDGIFKLDCWWFYYPSQILIMFSIFFSEDESLAKKDTVVEKPKHSSSKRHKKL